MSTTGERGDTELVRLARSGDQSCFQALCDRHGPGLIAQIRRNLSPPILRKVSASDVLQEAYLTAYQRLGEFEDRGDGAFAAWLAAIVRHKLLDAARRYAGTAKRGAVAEVSRGGRADTAAFAAGGPSPSALAIDGERKERVRAALPTLPPDYREVLELRLAEQLSVKQVAERMGRSPDAVKKLYARALALLADVVRGPGGGGDA